MQTTLLQKLQKLPAYRLSEVENFIEFLIIQEEQTSAANRLSEALLKLDAIDMPAISNAEIEIEINQARQELAIKRI